jgi:hypothetical protein
MPTRSAVENHHFWGEFSTTSELPNVAGASVQKSWLEVGDTAWVPNACHMFVCTDATINAAAWAPLDNGIDGSSREVERPGRDPV